MKKASPVVVVAGREIREPVCLLKTATATARAFRISTIFVLPTAACVSGEFCFLLLPGEGRVSVFGLQPDAHGFWCHGILREWRALRLKLSGVEIAAKGIRLNPINAFASNGWVRWLTL